MVDRSGPGGCPSADALSAFAGGEVRPDEVARHIGGCDACRGMVSDLAAASDSEDRRDARVLDLESVTATEPALIDEPRIGPGSSLGRFTVTRLLGHGAMGEVWGARDPELDREVAVKVLRLRAGSLGDEAKERLRREAQAMARLKHPNVVAIYELATHDDQIFCAMELVDGVTFRTYMETPRPWRQVLEILLAVGRGVAAAHASGLVHRDIKPDNILMAEGGRALISDFGLARLLGDRASTGSNAAGSASSELTSGAIEYTTTVRAVRSGHEPGSRPGLRDTDEQLTITGMMIGTPAYMPLEQLKGRTADARSDQFSFCATAYEALFGVRPIVGDSLEALMESSARGARAPRDRKGVPRGVTRCLLRGLARDPADRFPSMELLLAELGRGAAAPGRRRRMALALAAVVAAAGGATAYGLTREDSADKVRSAAESRIDRAWNRSRRDALRAHFVASGSAIANEQLAATVSRLDAYRAEWLAQRIDAWAATQERREQTAQVLDRRVACLDRLAGAMGALVDVVSRSDDQEIARAAQLVYDLEPVSRCANLGLIAHEPPRPSTPEGQAAQAGLFELEAQILAGRGAQALESATALVTRLETTADKQLLPRAVHNLGATQVHLGRHQEAEATLRRALQLAAAAQDHPLVAEIWLRLFSLIGLDQRRPGDAMAFEPVVRAAVAQAGDDPRQRADLAKALGLFQMALGDRAAARDRFIEARDLHSAASGPMHPNVALAESNLASALLHLGQLDDASARLERAIAIMETTLKRRHPTVALAYQNLCALHARRGDWTASERACRGALAINLAIFGGNHPEVAKNHLYLGRALHKQGRLAEAQREMLAAREIRGQLLPEGNPERVTVDIYLAQIAEQRNDLTEAERLARGAVDALRKHDPAGPNLAFPLSILARIVARRSPAEALDIYDQALTIHVAESARDRSGDAETLAEVADVALAARKPRRALRWFERMPEAASRLAKVRQSLERRSKK